MQQIIPKLKIIVILIVAIVCSCKKQVTIENYTEEEMRKKFQHFRE